jgi:molecular chaperone GrpE
MKTEDNMRNNAAEMQEEARRKIQDPAETQANASQETENARPQSEAGKPAEDVAYQKLAAEKQELFDRLLRKQAELENFRKRVQRDKEEFLQHANAELLRSLLPVLDGFDRALKHRNHSIPPDYYVGLELIHRQLTEALGKAGLTPIESKGELFDPELHQAAEKVETQEHQDQEVVEELQRGYKLRHRLLRPAVVKVAVHPIDTEQEPSSGPTSES